MRGKPAKRRQRPAGDGITPAGAGKTAIVADVSARRQDHPRRCGENHHPPVRHHRRGGSPPQVRGKQYMNDSKKALLRITPAGAGKTKTKRTLMDVIRDHPRRCGENWDTSCCIIAADGSPPQVRGKQPFHSYRLCSSRITPAGAGKTAGAVGTRAGARDHPRRCGENDVPQYSRQRPHGSPPQVRGKPTKKMCPAPCIRITPAGAGKTQRAQRANPALKDHPRRCGENRIRRTRRRPTLGSPPQVRGKHEPCRAHGLERRITPAGAGKTRTAESIHVSAKDHPRRCGENSASVSRTPRNLGSPPQVRGKLIDHGTECICNRITPAGAGKTSWD